MSTHNICFCGEIKTNLYFLVEKNSLSRAVYDTGKKTFFMYYKILLNKTYIIIIGV